MRATQRLNRFVRVVAAGVGRHLPLVVLGFSVSVNLVLASRLLQAQPKTSTLAVGTSVAGFSGAAPAGDPVSIHYEGDKPTILYYFSPSCGWCERNWPNVRELAAATSDRYRFVAVSPNAVTPLFVGERALAFEVAGAVDAAVLRQYEFRGTPQTLVVSPNGRVLRSWAEAYSGTQAKEVESYFGVRLPGLLSLKASAEQP